LVVSTLRLYTRTEKIILTSKAIYQVRLSIAGYNLIDTLFPNKTTLVATNYTPVTPTLLPY